jgi:hypothetical protein
MTTEPLPLEGLGVSEEALRFRNVHGSGRRP